jgi:hypothetical protein
LRTRIAREENDLITLGSTAGLAAVALIFAAGCASVSPAPQAGRSLGWQAPLGKGTVTSYAELDNRGAPAAIGVAWSAGALDDLPAGSDNHRCFGRNKEGALDASTQCQHTFEYALPLPDAVARHPDIPFKWVLLNWNPVGHIPPGIYDAPHFDVHFMMAPIAEIFAIEPGPCGPEFVRCDQFRTGTKPLPSNYMHADFRSVDAVVPAMGNHLIDLTGPEFNKEPFTRSWIYGVYDGKVTFYEEMVTRSPLMRNPDACSAIKAPEAVEITGFYPTVSCIRHNPATGERTVSLEKFVMRTASAPAPARMGK